MQLNLGNVYAGTGTTRYLGTVVLEYRSERVPGRLVLQSAGKSIPLGICGTSGTSTQKFKEIHENTRPPKVLKGRTRTKKRTARMHALLWSRGKKDWVK